MATRFSIALQVNPGPTRIRVRVASPYGLVRLTPIIVNKGAGIGDDATNFTANALDDYAYLLAPVPISIGEPVAASDAAGNAAISNHSLLERALPYDRYQPSGLTVDEILAGATGFVPWWYRWKGGGTVWNRRWPR